MCKCVLYQYPMVINDMFENVFFFFFFFFFFVNNQFSFFILPVRLTSYSMYNCLHASYPETTCLTKNNHYRWNQ